MTTQEATQVKQEYFTIGEEIIQGMIDSQKSILMISGKGTGKTTTLNHYVEQIKGNCTIYALVSRESELEIEQKLTFAPEKIPVERRNSMTGEERSQVIKEVLEPIFATYEIYWSRRGMSAKDLAEAVKTPVRLILRNWDEVYEELKVRLATSELMEILSMIRQMIAQGSDCNVNLYIEAKKESLNIVGMTQHATSYQALNLYSQGFMTNLGGDLDTIRLVMRTVTMWLEGSSEKLLSDYSTLCDAIANKKINSPIIFTNTGGKPRVGIVPNLIKEEV